MSSMSSVSHIRPPRRRRTLLRTGAGVVLFLIALGVLTTGIRSLGRRVDLWRAPWADASRGPTLTGIWVGSLTTGRGARRGVLLELRASLPSDRSRGVRRRRSRRSGPSLTGTALMCGGAGGEQRFTVHGRPHDRAGSQLYLGVAVADSTPPDGLAPSNLQGRWNGSDSLALEAALYLRDGVSAITDSDDPDTGAPVPLRMARGTESQFRALCGRIAPR
jgi:hypothetical protein